MYKFVLVLIFLHISRQQDFSPIADLKTLSELPLDKLLEVRNTLNINNNYINNEIENELANQDVDTPAATFSEVGVDGKSWTIPEAQAVRSKRKGLRRGEYSHDVYHKKDKKGLQSVFQLSVTTLAFLAFGGYLVCLLVQAFKSKQNIMTATPTTATASGPALLVVRKGKPKRRRPQRVKGVQPRLRRSAEDSEDTDMGEDLDTGPWSDADQESMYQAMTMLAEGYNTYQIKDYKYYNATNFGD